MVNRDRHEITIEILKKTRNGKTQTEIMRDANLSYTQSKLYLRSLVAKGLIEKDRRRFMTTEKGLEFVEKCEDCPLFKWETSSRVISC